MFIDELNSAGCPTLRCSKPLGRRSRAIRTETPKTRILTAYGDGSQFNLSSPALGGMEPP